MEKEFKYNAFISYRHLDPDKPVAEKLQQLLETYVPPKGVSSRSPKKLKLFRDESELPTSSDLSADIHNALQNSEFLIVVCSPETKESKWCIEEINSFKALHNNRNYHILTMYVSRDGVVSFPQELCSESVTYTDPDGNTVELQRELEPLAANVSAPTTKESLQKLNSEFLRIAAPLLHCSYDDLYQREQRRRVKRRRRILLSVTAAVLAVAIGVTTIITQQKRIADNALELKTNQAQMQLRDSLSYAADGDMYDALDAAVSALPSDDNDIPLLNAAVDQTAKLTGAFESSVFAPVKKLEHDAAVDQLCMLSGDRLFSADETHLYLWDTETGETVRTYDRTNYALSKPYHYQNTGLEILDKTTISASLKGDMYCYGSGDVGMYCKDTIDEEPIDPAALYLLEDGAVSRISPEDGEPLWTYQSDEEMTGVLVENPTNEGVVIRTSSKKEVNSDFLKVLSPEDGSVIASMPLTDPEIKDAITGIFSKLCYVGDKLTVVTNKSTFYVFENKDGVLSPLFSKKIDIGEDALYSVGSVLIEDDRIVMDLVFEDDPPFPYSRIFAYSLSDGEKLWSYKSGKIGGAGHHASGLIRASETSKNDFDIIFHVLSSRILLNRADTGELIREIALPDEISDAYYSDKGFLFVTSGQYEYAFSIRKITDASSNILSYMLHDFKTKLSEASCYGEITAACEKKSDSILLYRLVENDRVQTAYTDEEYSLASFQFSPSKELAAIYFTDISSSGKKPFIRIYDNDSGEVVSDLEIDPLFQSFSFFNDDLLLVKSSEALTLYNVRTGEISATIPAEDYFLYHSYIPSSGKNEILLEKQVKDDKGFTNKQAVIHNLDTSEDDVIFDENTASENDTDQHWYLENETASDDLAYVVLFISKTSADEDLNFESSKSLRIYNRADGTFTDDTEIDSTLFDACLFSEDGKLMYLLQKGKVNAYDTKTGKLVQESDYDRKIVDMIIADGKLCLLDNVGNLVQTKVEKDRIVSASSFSTGKSSNNYKGSLSYEALDEENRGVIRYLDNAWLIDTDRFEVIYSIYDYCGTDGSDLIYTEKRGSIQSYTIPTVDELLADAEHML